MHQDEEAIQSKQTDHTTFQRERRERERREREKRERREREERERGERGEREEREKREREYEIMNSASTLYTCKHMHPQTYNETCTCVYLCHRNRPGNR